jgi:hypothetical protein
MDCMSCGKEMGTAGCTNPWCSSRVTIYPTSSPAMNIPSNDWKARAEAAEKDVEIWRKLHKASILDNDKLTARAEAAERERDEALDAVGKNIEYSRELRERITRLEKALGAFIFWYESDHEPATGKGNDELQRRLDFAVEKMKAVFPFACGGIVSATTPPTAGAGKVK